MDFSLSFGKKLVDKSAIAFRWTTKFCTFGGDDTLRNIAISSALIFTLCGVCKCNISRNAE